MILNIDPIAIQIGHFGIRWFSLFVVAALLIGIYTMVKQAPKKGLNEDFVYNAALVAIIAGIAGARLVYVFTNWGYYSENLAEIIRIDKGGIAWHGGLLGGVLAGWWYGRSQGITFGAIADLAVPGLSLGYTLGRIGDIFNMDIPGRLMASGIRQPAQLYGAAIGLILLLMFVKNSKRNPPPGYLFWSFVLWYQVLRAGVEETVRDNPLYAWGYVNDTIGIGFFTLTQLVTPFVVILALIMMRRARAAESSTQREQ